MNWERMRGDSNANREPKVARVVGNAAAVGVILIVNLKENAEVVANLMALAAASVLQSATGTVIAAAGGVMTHGNADAGKFLGFIAFASVWVLFKSSILRFHNKSKGFFWTFSMPLQCSAFPLHMHFNYWIWSVYKNYKNYRLLD